MPTSPFCCCPMPTFSSCDNTGTRDLKRHIVKHKPVTHASIQTLRLTRLTRCQHCDDYDLHTFLSCANGRGGQSNDLMQTDWHVLTVLNTVHARTHRSTCAHEHTHSLLSPHAHEIRVQTLWPRLQLSLFTAFTIVE